MTDAGEGYIKVMGNPEGEHALACELVGTLLARWFGLPTLEHHILRLEEADVFPLGNRGKAKAGPAFITRAIRANPWGGKARALRRLENPEDIARLVIVDTWLLNPDRYPRIPPPSSGAARKPNRNNVLLTHEGVEGRRLRLVAIDFSHAFTSGRELTRRLSEIQYVQDEGIYGLFCEFRPYVREEIVVAAARRLREVSERDAAETVAAIPTEWDVSAEARAALAELICRRARWLADRITDRLSPLCFPQREFRFTGLGGDPKEE
jgi:hypothetical protein